MPLLIVQRPHYPRTSGATGTEGEQLMGLSVAALIKAHIRPGWTLRIIDADIPDASYAGGDVFIAIHGDGNTNRSIRGAAVGYRNAQGATIAAKWKAAYEARGWPGGWHRDNYTTALSGYYGVRKAVENGTTTAFIVEVGMMTNPADRAWIDANHATIAASVWDAVAETETGGGDEMKLLDPVPVGYKRVYRLWHPTHLHHYTISIAEVNSLILDPAWRFEDGAFDLAATNTVPVYRVLRANGKHFFTTSTAERDAQIAARGKDEGIAFYAAANGIPVIRFQNGDGHLYTTSEAEGAGMVRDGVAWYCGVVPAFIDPHPSNANEQIATLEAREDKALALARELVTLLSQ